MLLVLNLVGSGVPYLTDDVVSLLLVLNFDGSGVPYLMDVFKDVVRRVELDLLGTGV